LIKGSLSEHEREVIVSETVSNVHIAGNVCVAPVVSKESGPELTPNDRDCLCDIGEDGPALVGHVNIKSIEEDIAVDGFMASN
jgi:hypothetical protein